MLDIINIAICDDEKIQVELLHKYVNNWASESNIKIQVDTFHSAESFEFTGSKKYNILLLDIEMSGKNGVELAKDIRKEDNILNIIFITAITDYIGEGYNVDAINYLIKPIEEKRLYECLDRSIKKIPQTEKTVLVNVDGENIRIMQADIIYIEAFSHTIEINTMDEKHTVRKNIGDMERELDANILTRCHRSYIVGLKHIKKIGKTDIGLDNNHVIPVSRRLYSSVNMEFIKYFRGELDE